MAEILHYTYDDYVQWEGEWELIEGIPVSMSPAPVKKHQQLVKYLMFALESSLDPECSECEILHETDWKVSEETVVRPDVAMVCGDEHELYLSKAPKLITEVLSPSTAKKDESVKFGIYEAEGVQYYILVYPEDLKAKVYTLKEGRYIKMGDFTHERAEFDDLACRVCIDFGSVFEKVGR